MARTQPTHRKDQVITLLSTIHGVDPDTQEPTETPTERTIFAAKKSVWMREHYTAAAFDLRPEIVFVVWKREYQGEEDIRYNDNKYQLIRAYEPNREEIELICSGPGPRPRTR